MECYAIEEHFQLELGNLQQISDRGHCGLTRPAHPEEPKKPRRHYLSILLQPKGRDFNLHWQHARFRYFVAYEGRFPEIL
ncbi:unnamed protein product [Litomosoides sigmodontis]|uniref:Uncharacterized protein n=1 Tax=Litomosoides sigmodontis TaxID=42156 RepID=A0A3P6S5T2_LITSI|nr:unnamed protein product [Litomosoides sigmodontis]